MTRPENGVKAASVPEGIGRRLREERQRLGMNQTAFSEAAGTHRNTLVRYECGQRVPDTTFLTAIEQIGCDTSYLLTGTRRFTAKAASVGAADQIVDGVLAIGTKRSAEYRRGMLDVLRFRLEGERIQCPYREGTPQFDAYFAGNDRGHAVWRAMQQTEPAA